MRKLAWLTLIAAAAFFTGVPERAFAHSAHDHAQHSEIAAPTSATPVTTSAAEPELFFFEAALPDSAAKSCPHGQQQADCGACCGCGASASIALPWSEIADGAFGLKAHRIGSAASLEMRRPTFDLSRPPKSIA